MNTQALNVTHGPVTYSLLVTWRHLTGVPYEAGDIQIMTIDWCDGTPQAQQVQLLTDKYFLADVHDALCSELSDRGPDEAGPSLSGSYDASSGDE